jgi:hypothetical protein
MRQAAYESVKIGDREDFVIARFGKPSIRETPGKVFSRYAASGCQALCAERLWFENRLALQLPFMELSESMGNHDSNIVDAGSVD